MQAVFDRHYRRCFFKEGDAVRFRRPKKNPVQGKIDYIETDINQMYWTQEGHPRYIRVEVEGKTGPQFVWVAENKIMKGKT